MFAKHSISTVMGHKKCELICDLARKRLNLFPAYAVRPHSALNMCWIRLQPHPAQVAGYNLSLIPVQYWIVPNLPLNPLLGFKRSTGKRTAAHNLCAQVILIIIRSGLKCVARINLMSPISIGVHGAVGFVRCVRWLILMGHWWCWSRYTCTNPSRSAENWTVFETFRLMLTGCDPECSSFVSTNFLFDWS